MANAVLEKSTAFEVIVPNDKEDNLSCLCLVLTIINKMHENFIGVIYDRNGSKRSFIVEVCCARYDEESDAMHFVVYGKGVNGKEEEWRRDIRLIEISTTGENNIALKSQSGLSSIVLMSDAFRVRSITKETSIG